MLIHLYGYLITAYALYRFSAKVHKAVIVLGENRGTIQTPVSFNERGAWVVALIFVLGILHVIGGSHTAHSGILESVFQRVCEKGGIMNVWHESVPERAGRATSDVAVAGCAVGLGVGQYHFSDSREYAYFMQSAQPAAR